MDDLIALDAAVLVFTKIPYSKVCASFKEYRPPTDAALRGSGSVTVLLGSLKEVLNHVGDQGANPVRESVGDRPVQLGRKWDRYKIIKCARSHRRLPYK